MKNTMKRILGFVLAALLLLGSIPSEALAAEQPNPIVDTLTLDGITYFNVNSSNGAVPRKFYMDLLTTKSAQLGGHSIADQWWMI